MRASLAMTAAAILIAAAQLEAINDSAGTTGFSFLKIGMGARPTAMGGTFVAVPADAEAPPWNPAGLHGVTQRTGSVTLNSYLVDTQAGAASVAFPGRIRTWAAGITYVTYGEMEQTDQTGRELGTFTASDMAAYVTLAQPVWRDQLVAGISLKAVYSSIADYSSDAYMADVGLLFHGPLAGMTLGTSLTNLGSVRSGYAGNHKDSLPVNFRLGVAHRPAHMPVPMLLLADLTVPNDADAHVSFGAEIELPAGLYVRPGYSAKQTGTQGDEALGLTGGLGVSALEYRLDYSYASYPDLGDVHRISLTGSF